jgi:hypothetical protein
MQRVYIIKGREGIGRFMTDLVADLNRWNFERPIKVQVTEPKSTRSLSQNSLYWKWIGIISDAIGDDNDTVHDALRLKFLEVKLSKIDNRAIASSTTKLNTKEMSDYLNKIEAWAQQFLNITLPTPDDLIDYSAYER